MGGRLDADVEMGLAAPESDLPAPGEGDDGRGEATDDIYSKKKI